MPRFYMIPGSATDWRMYAPQIERFPFLEIPEWLPPLDRKETLKSYAWRFAKQIDTSTPFVLGGVSLGGMIAQEIARYTNPEALLLISTCDNSKSIGLWWRLNGKFTRLMPNWYARGIMRMLAKIVEKAKNLPRKELYARMLREMPLLLVRWQSGASTEWTLGTQLEVPTLRIHGTKDKIIPFAKVEHNIAISEGGHLINVTHADEVNGYISEFLEKYLRPHQGAAYEATMLPYKALEAMVGMTKSG